MKSRILLLSLVFLITKIHAETDSSVTPNCTPTQIHLSFGDKYYSDALPLLGQSSSAYLNNNQAYLVWQSQDVCEYSVLVNNQTLTPAFSTSFSYDSGTQNYTSVSYTVLFQALSYGTNYEYSITDQSTNQTTGPFSLTLPNSRLMGDLQRMLVVGNLVDQPNGNSTIDRIYDLTKQVAYGGLIQLGGVPYYMVNQNESSTPEYFTNSFPNFTTSFPLIMTPGQAETSSNSFFEFITRDPLYNMSQNQYFSFNVQGMHFVSINLAYYNLNTTNQTQVFSWIEDDLKQANTLPRRAQWPFIIVLTSEPVACLVSSSSPCAAFAQNNGNWSALFSQYNVDMVISGGLNEYQQFSLPATQNQINFMNVTNPEGPMYIIEGVGSTVSTPENPNPTGFGVLYAQQNSGNYNLTYEHYNSDLSNGSSVCITRTTVSSAETNTTSSNETTANSTTADSTNDDSTATNTTSADSTTSNPTNSSTNETNNETKNDSTNTTTNTDNGSNSGHETANNQTTSGDTTNSSNGSPIFTPISDESSTPTTPPDNAASQPTDDTTVDPDGSESILPRLIIPCIIIILIIIVAIYWKRRTPDPETERLRSSEFKSNRIYGNRSTEASISMVDLVL